MLFVTEVAVVMDELEGVATLTVLAEVRLNDFPSLDVLLHSIVALEALEAGLLHLGDDV